jgi:hypothetical protein
MQEFMVSKWRGLGAAMAAVLALSAGTGVHAAAYRGKIDPLYGATIDGQPSGNLGWRAEVTIDIPLAPGCFTNASGVPAAFGCIDTGPNKPLFKSAELFFYDYVTNVDLATVTWGEVDLSGVPVYGIYDDGTKPTALDSDLFPQFLPVGIGTFGSNLADDDAYGNFLDYAFGLRFIIEAVLSDRTEHGFPTGFQDPILEWIGPTDCGVDTCRFGRNAFDSADSRTKPTVSFTAVPEPGSLAMVMLSLLAAFGTTRRARPLGRC